VTVAGVLLATVAGWLLVAGHNVWAAFAIHASSVVDGTDGYLARLTRSSNSFGAVFDAVLDRYADAAIFRAWRGGRSGMSNILPRC
jgi:phosphatidylglycerophosphate synthase